MLRSRTVRAADHTHAATPAHGRAPPISRCPPLSPTPLRPLLRPPAPLRPALDAPVNARRCNSPHRIPSPRQEGYGALEPPGTPPASPLQTKLSGVAGAGDSSHTVLTATQRGATTHSGRRDPRSCWPLGRYFPASGVQGGRCGVGWPIRRHPSATPPFIGQPRQPASGAPSVTSAPSSKRPDQVHNEAPMAGLRPGGEGARRVTNGRSHYIGCVQ